MERVNLVAHGAPGGLSVGLKCGRYHRSDIIADDRIAAPMQPIEVAVVSGAVAVTLPSHAATAKDHPRASTHCDIPNA